MTRNDIIRMAQQCGFGGQARITNLKRLEQFAALVAASEREACARAASIALLGADKSLSDRVLNAIRSRGQRE